MAKSQTMSVLTKYDCWVYGAILFRMLLLPRWRWESKWKRVYCSEVGGNRATAHNQIKFKNLKKANAHNNQLHGREDGTYIWEHVAEQLKKLLRNEIPNLQIPPPPSKIYTVKNQPIIGDASSDFKKLQKELDKGESEKMEVIVDSLGLVIQPDKMPELNSLKGKKIR